MCRVHYSTLRVVKAAVDLWGLSDSGRIEQCIPKVWANKLATHGAMDVSCLLYYVACCAHHGQKIVLHHGSGTVLSVYVAVCTAGHNANPCQGRGSKTMPPSRGPTAVNSVCSQGMQQSVTNRSLWPPLDLPWSAPGPSSGTLRAPLAFPLDFLGPPRIPLDPLWAPPGRPLDPPGHTLGTPGPPLGSTVPPQTVRWPPFVAQMQ